MRWTRATGKVLWRFEPQVDFKNARSACCDMVNRGVAVWKGKVYVATFDGMLYLARCHATARCCGRSTPSTTATRAYSVTGAPQIAGKVVVIGNGGAEYDSRGYVTAYDLETGKQAWRFYTVPRRPEAEARRRSPRHMANGGRRPGTAPTGSSAAAAMPGMRSTTIPELNLVYFGTANGAPWNRALRSPGGGDNLFLSSIVALERRHRRIRVALPDHAGRALGLRRHAAPDAGDAQARNGADRKVLMQASKNGFFYVLDRKTGELLSADKFVDVNWADARRPQDRPADREHQAGRLQRRQAAAGVSLGRSARTTSIPCR